MRKENWLQQAYMAGLQGFLQVVFGTSMKVIDRATNEVKNLEVKLTPDDSPIDVAKQIQAKFNIDFVTYRWLLRSFEHSFARLNEDEVAKVDVTIGEKKVTINLCDILM